MSKAAFDFSDDALDALFSADAPASDEPVEALRPSDDVHALARQLTGQYVDVLASFTRRVFGERSPKNTADRALTALDALLRLARSVRDDDLEVRLRRLQDHLTPGVPNKSRARTRFLNELQRRLLELSEALDPADGERLKNLLNHTWRSTPLLDELAAIRGIGPKRLNRMYCAGLYTIDTVANADPLEVAAVTGLPQGLAQTVVQETNAFARRERERCVRDIEQRVRQFSVALPHVNTKSEEGRALLDVAQRALAELARAIDELREET